MRACQVDFYLLGSPDLDPRRLACRLAMMAWERGHAITVVTPDTQAAAQLDALMWESPEGRFLPHEVVTGQARGAAPVAIQSAPPDSADVVINLTNEPLAATARFRRLLEIVPHQAHDRETSRRKYRAYLDQGLEPATHEIN